MYDVDDERYLNPDNKSYMDLLSENEYLEDKVQEIEKDYEELDWKYNELEDDYEDLKLCITQGKREEKRYRYSRDDTT